MTTKNIFLLVLFCLSISCSSNNETIFTNYKTGDILFQDSSNSELSEAIKEVTHENSALNFSHVGILFIDNKKDKYVIEAISEGVCKTPLDNFLARNKDINGKPKVAIARLDKKFTYRISSALKYALTQIGKPYDYAYLMDNKSIYCSELIYNIFVKTGDKTEIFKLKPMTFKNSDTNKFVDTWIQHYKELNIEIPEGKLGLNPNGMSKSENIKFIYFFNK